MWFVGGDFYFQADPDRLFALRPQTVRPPRNSDVPTQSRAARQSAHSPMTLTPGTTGKKARPQLRPSAQDAKWTPPCGPSATSSAKSNTRAGTAPVPISTGSPRKPNGSLLTRSAPRSSGRPPITSSIVAGSAAPTTPADGVSSSSLTPTRPEARVTCSHTSKRRSTTMAQIVHLESFSAPTGPCSLLLGMRTLPAPTRRLTTWCMTFASSHQTACRESSPHTCATPVWLARRSVASASSTRDSLRLPDHPDHARRR